MPWGPAIDGVALPRAPLAAVAGGSFNRVPMVLGTNRDEGSIFVPVMPLIARGVHFPPEGGDVAAIIERAFNMFPAAAVRNLTQALVLPAYPLRAFARNDSWVQATTMITHAVFTCATRRAAYALVDQGVRTWLYQFSYAIDWDIGKLVPQLGTCEGGGGASEASPQSERSERIGGGDGKLMAYVWAQRAYRRWRREIDGIRLGVASVSEVAMGNLMGSASILLAYRRWRGEMRGTG
jgi:hypothetical protein